jgi:hypothetical protein
MQQPASWARIVLTLFRKEPSRPGTAEVNALGYDIKASFLFV